MSLVRLRRSARPVAALLLLVSAVGLQHRSRADDICVPAGLEAHDESKHVVTPVSEAEHQQHCAVCHWLRWMKPVFSQKAVSAAQQDSATDLILFAAQSVRDPASGQLPARAPPSDLS